MNRLITNIFLISIFVLSNLITFAQHDVGTAWGEESIIPRFNESLNSKQRGVLYNNMVVTSTGRIIISTSEMNPSNLNQVYGYYFTYSDDGGNNWEDPKTFSPLDLVIGGSSVKLAMDSNDTLYVLWNSVNPSAIFISKLDKDLNVIKDSIRVTSKMLYGGFATHFSIDKKNRIHVMWHEGSTNSINIAESFYTRSTNGGLTWDAVTPISSNDGHHSAFPHAQFDNAGDTLAIAWRDSVGISNQWDVYMVFSTNGGVTWSSSPVPVVTGIDADWDPDLLIDPSNRIHLFYTKYPRNNPFDGARNYYQYSDDVGTSWNYPTNPSDGIISDLTRSQLIEGTRYDVERNILYVTWKDERDFNHTTGAVEGDIMLAYSTDRGLTWSVPEFITDKHDSTVGFKAGALMPSGDYAVNYEVISQDNISDPNTSVRVYFRKRSAVTVGVLEDSIIPESFMLYQNYPNPFNPTTTIRFSLPKNEFVQLKVFNMLGQEITKLIDGELNSGEHSVVFNANDLASGIYFYQLKTNSFTKELKAAILK
ncbi:MAG: exo-alpha-sialidase [Bacteroidota bacterium]